MNLRFIMMSCGYVESSKTSWLIYGCQFLGRESFPSYKEAITELALDLYAKYYDEWLFTYRKRYGTRFEECCKKSLTDNNKAKFCSDCGKAIVDKSFDSEEFMRYVRGLHDTDCDNYGDAELAYERDLVWWPWSGPKMLGVPREEVILIAEDAEEVLLQALLEAMPELATNGDEPRIAIAFRYETDWEKFKRGEQPTYG